MEGSTLEDYHRSTPARDFNRQHLESFPSPPLPQPRKPDLSGSKITSCNLPADTIDLYFFSLFKQEKTGSEDKTKFKPDSRIQRLFLLFIAFEQAEFLHLRVRSRLPPGSRCPRSGLPPPRILPQPPRGLETDETARSDERAVWRTRSHSAPRSGGRAQETICAPQAFS